MKFAQLYNKTNFDIDTKKFQFEKLENLYKAGKDKVHNLNGLFLNQSQYGKQGVAIVAEEKILVDLPIHFTNTVEKILADLDCIETIKEGQVGFKVYEYESKNRKNKKCYSIKFVDL